MAGAFDATSIDNSTGLIDSWKSIIFAVRTREEFCTAIGCKGSLRARKGCPLYLCGLYAAHIHLMMTYISQIPATVKCHASMRPLDHYFNLRATIFIII